jgi:hypothetical protein
MVLDLERFRLRGAPPYDLSDVYLVPDYVSPLEEQSLARQISASQQAWVQVRLGRLAAGPKRGANGDGSGDALRKRSAWRTAHARRKQ